MSKAAMAKALPQFHPELRLAPGAPAGERILVRPLQPPKEGEGGLYIPETAQERPYSGTVVAVGDQAANAAYDDDLRIGDEVWWSKYSGVIEEWHRITKPGRDPSCPHESVWEFKSIPGDRMQLRECRSCGAEKLSEPLMVQNVADVLANVSKQLRFERGQIRRVRGETPEGKTMYVLEREADFVDTLEIKE